MPGGEQEAERGFAAVCGCWWCGSSWKEVAEAARIRGGGKCPRRLPTSSFASRQRRRLRTNRSAGWTLSCRLPGVGWLHLPFSSAASVGGVWVRVWCVCRSTQDRLEGVREDVQQICGKGGVGGVVGGWAPIGPLWLGIVGGRGNGGRRLDEQLPLARVAGGPAAFFPSGRGTQYPAILWVALVLPLTTTVPSGRTVPRRLVHTYPYGSPHFLLLRDALVLLLLLLHHRCRVTRLGFGFGLGMTWPGSGLFRNWRRGHTLIVLKQIGLVSGADWPDGSHEVGYATPRPAVDEFPQQARLSRRPEVYQPTLKLCGVNGQPPTVSSDLASCGRQENGMGKWDWLKVWSKKNTSMWLPTYVQRGRDILN